jgi:hypothetical protein
MLKNKKDYKTLIKYIVLQPKNTILCIVRLGIERS